jgi:hypothetical protein
MGLNVSEDSLVYLSIETDEGPWQGPKAHSTQRGTHFELPRDSITWDPTFLYL